MKMPATRLGPDKIIGSLTDHPNWNEISTHIRLISALGAYTKQPGPTQMFVPEVMHIVSLVVAEGPIIVRKSVYGVVMNLLQALYVSRTDEIAGPELLQIIDHCSSDESLKLFGLRRETPTSEFTSYDAANEKERLDNLERFMGLLIRIMEVSSGSRGVFFAIIRPPSIIFDWYPGILNTWRARWLSLVTATAFQMSPVVQTRSFSALGALATAEVDEDFAYQILTAMNTALDHYQDKSPLTVVSMLRCICKMVPALSEWKRYVPGLFWLGVALIQTGHPAFFEEASTLIRTTLETMEQKGLFLRRPMSAVLLEARTLLEDITLQLDDMLGISFQTDFSLSLAHVIFKGVRHSVLKESAGAVLRTLLQVTARSYREANTRQTNGYNAVLCPEAMGYFIALLPMSSTTGSYARLLKDCLIDENWHTESGLPDIDCDDASAPRVTPSFLGIIDSNTALLVATFIGTMLGSAQGDDAETEMLYGLLAELAISFPEVISLVYVPLSNSLAVLYRA